MIEFLLFILGGVGITNLVVNASILDYPRDFLSKKSKLLKKLLSCMMCSGFWVGLLLGMYFSYPAIIAGASISLLGFFMSYTIDILDYHVAINEDELSRIIEDEYDGDDE